MKGWLALGSTLVLLPLFLLLLDPPDNLARGPGVALPFATLALMLALAGFAIADRTLPLHILSRETPGDPSILGGVSLLPCLIFFAFLAVALIPRIWNAAQFAKAHRADEAVRAREAARKLRSTDETVRAEADMLRVRKQENRDAEALSALVATITFVSIGALAWLASMWTDGKGLISSVGLWISFGVLALFAIVIFLDRLAEAAPIRAAGEGIKQVARRMAWLADFYDFLDSLLVRIGAHVAGTDHLKTRTRYLVLAGTMTALSIMAWFLPAPLGLVPAAMGLVLALSVSRLWSWVEEDRNMAAITKFNPDAPRRIGFREDFRDETLLGFLFVLLLIPIAIRQADLGLFGDTLFQPPEGVDINENNLAVWLGYFGFELAKALPVVDWADIYKLSPGEDLLEPTRPIGMHVVFIARVMVDLVLIASLLQAIGVATRNRQQKALYSEGHIDRLDELVERHELKKEYSKPPSEWGKGRIDFRRYNLERLRELYTRSVDDREKAYIKKIFDEGGYTLDSAIDVLTRISATTRNENALHLTFDLAKSDHERGRHIVEWGDLTEVMLNLRNKSGLESLKTEILSFGAKIAEPMDAVQMMRFTMFGGQRDDFQYTRKAAARLARDIVPKIDDCGYLIEFRSEVQVRRKEAFGSAQAIAVDLLAALDDRIRQLDCANRPPAPPEEGPPPHENKP